MLLPFLSSTELPLLTLSFTLLSVHFYRMNLQYTVPKCKVSPCCLYLSRCFCSWVHYLCCRLFLMCICWKMNRERKRERSRSQKKRERERERTKAKEDERERTKRIHDKRRPEETVWWCDRHHEGDAVFFLYNQMNNTHTHTHIYICIYI